MGHGIIEYCGDYSESPETYYKMRQIMKSITRDVHAQNSMEHQKRYITLLELAYWSQYNPLKTFIGDEFISFYLKYINKLNVRGRPADASVMSDKTFVPNVIDIPWKDLFEIRKAPLLTDYRNRFIEISRTNDPQRVISFYHDTQDRLIDMLTPNTRKAVFENTLGAIPLPLAFPIPSPFSIGFGIKSSLKEINASRNYKWLSVLKSEAKNAEEKLKTTGTAPTDN